MNIDIAARADTPGMRAVVTDEHVARTDTQHISSTVITVRPPIPR